jgi:hypothetical protein
MKPLPIFTTATEEKVVAIHRQDGYVSIMLDIGDIVEEVVVPTHEAIKLGEFLVGLEEKEGE